MTNELQLFARIVRRHVALLQRDESEAEVVAKTIYPILTDGLRISSHDVRLEESLLGTSSRHHTGRADIVVRMAGRPVLVVECKAPSRRLSWKHLRRGAVEQAERYATELQVDYVLLSNGFHWILTKGRSIVAEATDREELLKHAREFFEWLKPKSLWYSATDLVVPPDFAPGLDILRRCETLSVTGSDVSRLAQMKKEMPHLVPRLEEEVHKALAVMEINRFARSMPLQRSLSVIHMDPTFSTYRQGAWLYDPIYCWHRANEASFLSSCAKADRRQTSVRLFIVDHAMTSDWTIRLPDIGKQMLRDGWTIAIINKSELKDFDLVEGDVVGEHVIAGYHEGEAFDYRFERSPRRAKQFRDKVLDYMGAHPDSAFERHRHGIERLAENCYHWSGRQRMTSNR
jgi:hypothetical protein